jgi:hypothetical protein
MDRYDPGVDPDPAAWLALEDGERLALVIDYHRRSGVQPTNPQVHAVLHVVVENQVMLGSEIPVAATLARLVAEGLDRHAALHAIGGVLAELMFGALKAGPQGEVDNQAYYTALQRLEARHWRRRDGAPGRER